MAERCLDVFHAFPAVSTRYGKSRPGYQDWLVRVHSRAISLITLFSSEPHSTAKRSGDDQCYDIAPIITLNQEL